MVKTIIIDDSKIIGERLSMMFNEIDGVAFAGQGTCASEGLDLMHACKPDFVTLDISLPDISGIEIIEDIKRINPEACIAVLTNYPYPSYRQRCAELGADYFFDKKSEFTKLCETLAELAKRKKSGPAGDCNGQNKSTVLPMN